MSTRDVIRWIDPWKCWNDTSICYCNELGLFPTIWWLISQLNCCRSFICVWHGELLMYEVGPRYDGSSFNYRESELATRRVRLYASYHFFMLLPVSTIFIVLLSYIWSEEQNIFFRFMHLKWCSIFEYSRIVDVYHIWTSHSSLIGSFMENRTRQTIFIHRQQQQ